MKILAVLFLAGWLQTNDLTTLSFRGWYTNSDHNQYYLIRVMIYESA